MNVLTVDFETYYDREYSLSKMTMIEYIMDGRFQPIMMSYAINDEPVKNVIGYPNIKRILDSIDWNNTVLNAQNTAFDATIIRARFGHTARYYTDTMAMARVTAAHVFTLCFNCNKSTVATCDEVRHTTAIISACDWHKPINPIGVKDKFYLLFNFAFRCLSCFLPRWFLCFNLCTLYGL